MSDVYLYLGTKSFFFCFDSVCTMIYPELLLDGVSIICASTKLCISKIFLKVLVPSDLQADIRFLFAVPNDNACRIIEPCQ
jgi:hypothetical protein